MLRFDFIPYPLWRRRGLGWARPLLAGLTAAEFDSPERSTPARIAHYLTRSRLLPPGMDAAAARDVLEQDARAVAAPPPIADATAARYDDPAPLRLPAQWEPQEAVIVTWPVFYPPLWAAHAAMVAAIAPVARVDVLVPDAAWGAAARLYLGETAANLHILPIPTDDMWVRDYGPIVAVDDAGRRVAVSAIFDPLPTYPQARDNAMPERWAALRAMPVRALDLHLEGGNLWSDGAGTLVMSHDLYDRNPHLPRPEVERRLRTALRVERLVITPKLWREETGHVDLLVKLADAQTALISAPTPAFNRAALRQAAAVLRGAGCRVVELPTPPPYLNWFVYPVWRSYTNALTVNGRVLVPTFGSPQDADALAAYRDAMPAHEVIGIDCARAANGGGGVHCLTKEVAMG